MPRQLALTPHLTTVTELDKKAAETWAGMAHFAGTGPKGKTCRECAHWMNSGKERYAGTNKVLAHSLKPAPCDRFRELTGKQGQAVPHGASACSHFKENEKPPAAIEAPRW